MAPHDRFLNSRSKIESYGPLGRVFNVIRETWRLESDPRKTRPKLDVLTTRRSAADAADLARQAASGLDKHGFHKPSGAWWGSDGEHFHRFVVGVDRPGRTLLPLALGLLAGGLVAAAGVMRRRRGRDDGPE
jgi:hypothetical protein